LSAARPIFHLLAGPNRAGKSYSAVEAEQGAQQLIAMCEKVKTNLLTEKLPDWAAILLGNGKINKSESI
jgi:hypothetical protein